MHIHQRQFIIGPRPISFEPDTVVTPVPGIGYLCHCGELRVTQVSDAQGTVWLLLGLAVQSDSTRVDPAAAVATARGASIQDSYETWAGRWVLVGDGKLHMDSAGLLGCFYARCTVDGAEELWVASSAGLLTNVLHLNTAPLRTIQHEVGIDWYTPPFSRYRSIYRLLPSQILDLASGALLSRRLIAPLQTTLSYEDVLDRMQTCLTAALQNVAKLANTLWLPLTGGYDSRLLLATARAAHVPVQSYTLGFRGMSTADRTVPPQLARIAGITHALHWGSAFQRDLLDVYDQHTSGHCVDRDRYFMPRGYYNWYKPGDIVLRGGCFELGRCYYWSRFPGAGTDMRLPDADVILAGFRKLQLHRQDPLTQALHAWISWSRQAPHEEMDWRDRLYLEQRLAGWLSSVEQGLDLGSATDFHAANSHLYFTYALQVPLEKRRASQHQVDLMARMAPDLLSVPFNAPEPAYRRAVTKLTGKVRHYRKALSL